MPKNLNFICVVFLFVNNCVYGQNSSNAVEEGANSSIQLQFQPEINGIPLVLNQSYYIPILEDSVSIRSLKFYISDISFYRSKERIAQSEQRYFLFNLEDEESMSRSIALPESIEFDQVRFNIGVDSISQMKGAQGGDLDPMHGMYWTWQSGYINFKLEGFSKSCPGRNHVFQFHIGGFQAPFNSIQNVQLSAKSKDSLVIRMKLDDLFTKANITEEYEVMSPSVQAMNFAGQLSRIFNVGP